MFSSYFSGMNLNAGQVCTFLNFTTLLKQQMCQLLSDLCLIKPFRNSTHLYIKFIIHMNEKQPGWHLQEKKMVTQKGTQLFFHRSSSPTTTCSATFSHISPQPSSYPGSKSRWGIVYKGEFWMMMMMIKGPLFLPDSSLCTFLPFMLYIHVT